MLEFLSQPAFQRLALTLLHFLWQGAAVAAALGIVQWSLNRRGARVRYAACVAALAAVTAFPIATFVVVQPPAQIERAEVVAARSDNSAAPAPAERSIRPFSSSVSPASESASGPPPSPATRREVRTSLALFAAATPYLVLLWMLGVLLFGLRLLWAFAGLRRLLRDRVELPGEFLASVEQLARAMRLATAPLVCGSRRAAEAMAVGFFRPVVLLPVAWLAQVPADVLRSVVAHELAHVRRWDRWVNLLQRVVEAALFYHPAVWWISRRMRTEREFCCDEEAARVVGGAVRYAEALEHIGRLHWHQRQLLLTNTIGGTKMALLKRVRRVLGQSESTKGGDGWTVGLLAVCIPLMLLVASTWWPTEPSSVSAAVADDGDKNREKAERRERDGEKRRDAERREGERKERGDRRDREQPERKAADRPAPERRERDVPREGERGDRPRKGARPREGDRPRGEQRRDGDRPREGARKDRPDRPREPARRDGVRPDAGRRGGERPQPANLRELLEIIRGLQAEVRQLRKEVQELKGRRGDRPMGDRGGIRRDAPRRDGNDRPRREGEPRRDRERRP
jgi:beta-lactamase regulating signal transducer with metallopeptidase domain